MLANHLEKLHRLNALKKIIREVKVHLRLPADFAMILKILQNVLEVLHQIIISCVNFLHQRLQYGDGTANALWQPPTCFLDGHFHASVVEILLTSLTSA